MSESINIKINNQSFKANPEETILECAQRNGFHIPTLCHLKGLSPTGACRICVVETENGNLLPSCAYPVEEGMNIKTNTPRVMKSRKKIIELLIANHPQECLSCVRSGDCELQSLSKEYNITRVPYLGAVRKENPDVSSRSIQRDAEKCILCGRCVRVCEEVQGVGAIDFVKRGFDSVVAPPFEDGLAASSCVNCGQCINVCPTGALYETDHLDRVMEILEDEELIPVVQIAPASQITIGESFGIEDNPELAMKKLVNALKNAGFKYVFDTNVAADITIMEEGSELAHRITNNGVLPMMTSCSPAWIRYVETFKPEFAPNLSTCKSPHQMMGALIKSYFAELKNIPAKKIRVISIMPCTAKKYEAQRAEMSVNGLRDVDVVLTSRETLKLLNICGVTLNANSTDDFDNPFGEGSGAGKIFGTTGGVMEAAIRSCYFLLEGKNPEKIEFQEVRGNEGIRIAELSIAGKNIRVAICSGLSNAAKLLEKIQSGEETVHFMEVMSCPGGCLNGGGQPYHTNEKVLLQRVKNIYSADSRAKVRYSHENPGVQKIYREFLGKPLGELSHKLLHTHYSPEDK